MDQIFRIFAEYRKNITQGDSSIKANQFSMISFPAPSQPNFIHPISILQSNCQYMKLIIDYRDQSQKQSDAHIFSALSCTLTLEDDLRIIILHPEIVILCDGCERRLNNAASVLLLCQSKRRRDYCLTCFLKMGAGGSAAEQYYLRPNLNLSVTEQGWGIISELLLISALMKFGHGKWEQVKDYLDYHGHNFTSQQLKAHYEKFYTTQGDKIILAESFHECHPSPYQHEPIKIKQAPISPSEAFPQEEPFLAYDPKRDQHLLFYNPQAENLICDLELSPQDTPQDIEMKLQVLEQYDYLIKERQKREDFAVEHQMLSQEHHRALLSEGKVKNQARKFVERFSRFMTFGEVEALTKHLAFQETLKGAIMELSSGANKQTFSEKYAELSDKKERRKISHGACPMDLKVIPVSGEVKRGDGDGEGGELTEASALQQIRQLDFIEKNATITPLGRIGKR